MKIINANVEFITPVDGAAILKRLEQCGRVCYKSEAKITDTSAPAFVADAFCASRLAPEGAFHYGALPRGVDVQAIDACREIMEQAWDLGLKPWVLDIGGGFPVDYDGGEFDIDGFCAPIREALAKLPSQFLTSCMLRQLVAVFVGEVQELYDAVLDMQRGRTLYAAEAANLDALGRIVGEERAPYQYSDSHWFAFDRMGHGAAVLAGGAVPAHSRLGRRADRLPAWH